MALFDRIAEIATCLVLEAERRRNRATKPWSVIDFLENGGKVTHESRSASGSDFGRRFAELCRFPRQDWVLLNWNQEAKRCVWSPNDRIIQIIVYFRSQPKYQVQGPNQSKRRGKRKRIRAILRNAQKVGKLSGHVMCTDAGTRRTAIIDQIAIFLAQNGVFDDGTQRILGLRSADPITAQVGSRLVQNFIDPESAASYPAYKKALRLRVVGPEERAFRTSDDLESFSDDTQSHEEDRSKISAGPKKATHRRNENASSRDLGIREAASILGMPPRTLYQRIAERKVEVHSGWKGRSRISAEELENVRRADKERERKRCLISQIALRYEIDVRSARRKLARAAKKGVTIKDFAKEMAISAPKLRRN